MQPSLAQEARQAILLLTEYSFELGQQAPTAQVLEWLEMHRPSWIRDAVVEALYQGRYKAISVQQILALWQRREQPVRHFTKEFERAIAQPLGLQLTASLSVASIPSGLPTQQAPTTRNENGASDDLQTGLDQLADWDSIAPPFVQPQADRTTKPRGTGATSPELITLEVADPADTGALVPESQTTLRRKASKIATDRGVLTAAHQPIQPFRPELPFRLQRYRR